MSSDTVYVLSVIWQSKPGAENTVADILRQVAAAARKENGVLAFHVAQNPEQPTLFTLFEIYRDREAHAIHMATDEFKRLVLDQALPLLDRRERVVLQFVA